MERVALQAGSASPEASAVQAPEANAEGDKRAKLTHTPSEKEQLVNLQDRMSSEIERVRAVLKERSGRWKVRQTSS
jgi:hypothetical protein